MNDIAEPTSTPSRTIRRFSAWDVAGVFVLPFVCFAVDYAIEGLVVTTAPAALWTFALTGMAFFGWSLGLRGSDRAAPFASGTLLAAALIAGSIGLVLLPFSLLALMLAGLGLLGFVPFLTAWRFFRQFRRLLSGWAGMRPLLLGAGMIAAVAPAAAVFAFERTGEERREADLVSGDRERVLQVLRRTKTYTLGDLFGLPLFPAREVCPRLDRLPRADAEVERAVREFIGAGDSSPEERCAFLLDD